jgi:hypothetical protein
MFQQLLETIALGLEKRGIPYMVIGGQAVLLYGEPRLTRDIDVTSRILSSTGLSRAGRATLKT